MLFSLQFFSVNHLVLQSKLNNAKRYWQNQLALAKRAPLALRVGHSIGQSTGIATEQLALPKWRHAKHLLRKNVGFFNFGKAD